MKDLKETLEKYYDERNKKGELSDKKPDPLIALKENLSLPHTAEIALICALLAYGNAGLILKNLRKLDFSILDSKEAINRAIFPKYRFQTSQDIRILFLILNEIIKDGGIKQIFFESYAKKNNVIDGIHALIEILRARAEKYEISRGLDFLIGRAKKKQSSPLKRWNLMLRWLVRADNIDIGLWREVKTSDLILPLDTHTFRLSKALGLLSRKSYDLNSALEITQNLKKFDPNDPIKYDFSLYRLGQEKIL